MSSMTEGIVSSFTGEIVSKLISYATKLNSSARGCEDERAKRDSSIINHDASCFG